MTTTKRFILLMCLGWISACINVPEIDQRPSGTGTPQSDGGTGTPDAGMVPSELTLEFTSPVDPFYTSTTVPIAVAVRGGTPETLQLLKNGELLATLRSPFTYTWDTTSEVERSFTLSVRTTYAGKTFSSGPVTVVVDRTNLQVSSRTPTLGSTNVDYRMPIQVVFTKAVKASTISDTTVSFAVAGVLADKTLSLSSDNRTLTIIPKARPVLPAVFSIGLSKGITDLAGKALVVPSTPWSFDVPDWYAFGGPIQAVGGNDTHLKDPAMALDKQGNPIVAWSEELTPGGRFALFVYKWDGSAFSPLGGVLNATAVGSAFKVSMALDDDDKPVVAWQESDGFNENIYVKRWTGTSWQTVGFGALSAVNDASASPMPTPARNPSIALHGGDVYVAWDEVTLDSYSNIYVFKSSNGGGFNGLGSTEGGWVSAVPRYTSATKPSLVLDDSGLPVVAFQEETLEEKHPENIYVMRLQQNNKWMYAVPPFQDAGDGISWSSGGLSVLDGQTSARDCSLIIDNQGELILAWKEATRADYSEDIQVFQTTGPQSWARKGSPISAYVGGSTYAYQPQAATSANSGKVFLSWEEFSYSVDDVGVHVFVSQWNGVTWELLTSENGLNDPNKNATKSALSVDFLGRPVLVWLENTSKAYEAAPGDALYIRRHNN